MQVADTDLTDITSYVALMKQQLQFGGPDGGPDEELVARFSASGFDTLEEYLTSCNAHLGVPGSRPATHTVVVDQNSLYASSC